MAQKGYSFGTFQGVFVPSILTILGVIMYLRFGWVLGNVGLAKTLIIVTLATGITFLTALSLASLVTNSAVGGGGAYFVISRSLGIEAGAAIGLPLYCAQALGIAFYVAGFSESVQAIFPQVPIKTVAVVSLVAVTLLVYFSAGIALKFQLVILALIIASLVSFFMGSGEYLAEQMVVAPAPEPLAVLPFWFVFAVFFPAVTGIEAGLGMSGDLKNPARALTWGTLSAVVISFCVYLAIPLFLDTHIPDRRMLIEDTMIMAHMARWKWAVVAGLWGATISSAIGTILAAPRTLQALCNDRILPRFLGRGFGPGNDPRIATVISFAVGLGGVLLGDLNLIAPVLSMFFLTSYGLINLSAAFEGLVGSPWWRPSFRVPWLVSLVGAFACFAAMFLIDPAASMIAIFLSAGFYWFTKRRRLRAHWGDARAGILMWIAQQAIYKLEKRPLNERTWRPNLLVFTGSPSSRWYLVALADALTRGRGLMTVAGIVPAATNRERVQSLHKSISSYLGGRGIESLVHVHPAPGFFEGASSLIQAYGFGPIFPNTLLMGDPGHRTPLEEYLRVLFTAAEMKRNLILVKERAEEDAPAGKKKGGLDVWWDQESPNSGLLLTLGFLMRSSRHWGRSRLIVRSIVNERASDHNAEERIKRTVAKMRLGAKVEVVDNVAGRPAEEIILENSKDADFVLVGLQPPGEGKQVDDYREYFGRMDGLMKSLPAGALVMAREDIELDQIYIE